MNEYQQGYGVQQFGPQQFAPQGAIGGVVGAPVGGLIGRGIGGLFNNPGLGGRIGEWAGGILGGFSPFSADPSSAYAGQQPDPQQLAQLQQLQQLQQMQQMQQQGQLAPQGFFGNLISHAGRAAGGLVGAVSGNKRLGSMISDYSGYGKLLPFGADAQAQPQQQQGPLVQLQQLQVLQQQLQQMLQQCQQQQAVLQQQVAQQGGQQAGQIAPQGWVSDAITQYARPVGGFIGEQLGNQGLGNAIGTIASQLGRFVPFSADPYSQQQQFAGQQVPFGQPPMYAGQQVPYGQQTVH